MKVHQFSQQGKRSNNEDSLGINGCLLTVCDGMGGHNFGERASAFVKDALLQAFPEIRPLNKAEIQQQLNQVQTNLNLVLEKEPELENMGTTFTGVFRTPDVWYAAHIGDSRIYLFRPSEQKLWHTWDHSLVGELMRTHEITVEAGRFHHLSNRIAKAIIARKEGKMATASIVKIDQLKKGDILLLCSDGVVEGWGDLELVRLFSDNSLSFEQKCEKIAQQCNEKSKDNNTAIIAEIEENDAFSYGSNEELDWTTFAEVEADYQAYLKDLQEDEADDTITLPPRPPMPPVNTAATRPAVQPTFAPTMSAPPPPASSKPARRRRLLWLWLLIAGFVLLAAATTAIILIKCNEETTYQQPYTPTQKNKSPKTSDPRREDPSSTHNGDRTRWSDDMRHRRVRKPRTEPTETIETTETDDSPNPNTHINSEIFGSPVR